MDIVLFIDFKILNLSALNIILVLYIVLIITSKGFVLNSVSNLIKLEAILADAMAGVAVDVLFAPEKGSK